MHRIRVAGVAAVVRMGPQEIGRLERVALEPIEAPGLSWRVSGRVREIDAFYWGRGPMTIDVQIGLRVWRWSGVALERDGDAVTGTVSGRPDVRA